MCEGTRRGVPAHQEINVAPRGCDNEPTSQKVGALTGCSSFLTNGGCLYWARHMGSLVTLVGSPSLPRGGLTSPTIPRPFVVASLDNGPSW